MNNRKLSNFAGLLVILCGMSSVRAKDYDPLPKAWNIKIDLPGMLLVGAEYCTQMGKCAIVGDDIVGFNIRGTAIGGVQGCQMTPNAEPCVKARIPVSVLVMSPAGSVIVRLKGANYATSEDQVIVSYHNTWMTLSDYQACVPPPGTTHTYIGPPSGAPRCPS